MGSGGAVRSVATKLCRLSSNQQQPRCCALSPSPSPSPAPLPAVANSSDSIPHFSVSAASAAVQDPKFFPTRSRCTTSSSIASSSTQFALTRCFSSQLAPNEAKNVVFVDTLALVRKLESHGFSANQAEAITAVITDVLNDCLDSVGHSFVSKSDLQKSDMLQEAALLKLKTEVESSEEKKVSAIQREAEKIKVDIDKLKAEMRYEMDKISAGQRLDLNLERGRMREELAKQSADTSNLTNKLNKEIHALKTQLEASKYEVIKYCIGTIVSVMALGLGLLRIFK